jgi:hypothetical protein
MEHPSTSRRALRFGVKRLARPTYGRSLTGFAHRVELGYLLNARGLLGTGAEIGVKTGAFSEEILSRWTGACLISIDPWAEAPADEYVDDANVAQAEHERFLEQTRQRLRRFGERSRIWRMTGEAAATQVAAGELDFVFIDARHDYESVRADLEQWVPKVRAGGIVAGHDYVDGSLPQGEYGVKRAVDEFFEQHGLAVHTTYGDLPWASWLVTTPAAERSR